MSCPSTRPRRTMGFLLTRMSPLEVSGHKGLEILPGQLALHLHGSRTGDIVAVCSLEKTKGNWCVQSLLRDLVDLHGLRRSPQHQKISIHLVSRLISAIWLDAASTEPEAITLRQSDKQHDASSRSDALTCGGTWEMESFAHGHMGHKGCRHHALQQPQLEGQRLRSLMFSITPTATFYLNKPASVF